MRTHTAVLVVILSIGVAGSAHAQRIAVGVRGGLSRSTADVEGAIFTEDVGTTTKFHAGPLINIEISRYFALQTQFLYSRKGFAEGDGTVSIDVAYVEVPVLAMLQMPGGISPHLYVGPVLALESKCTANTALGGEEDCEDATTAPRTKGADSGIMLGGGVKLGAGPGFLLLDVLYSYGLTDVSEFRDDVDSIKFRTLYLSLGYALRMGSDYP
jgi:hypothetical protein